MFVIDVNLNGTTVVTHTQTCVAINAVEVIRAGTSLHNVGSLSVQLADTTLVAFVQPTESIAHMSHYTVPRGYTAFRINISASTTRSAGGSGVRRGELNLRSYNPDQNTQHLLLKYSLSNDGGMVHHLNPIPQMITEKTTTWLEFTGEVANCWVSTCEEIILVKGLHNNSIIV